MKIIDIREMRSPNGEVVTFHGFEHGANVCFFIVQFPSGKGPDRHRHPYEETFIVLDGEIETIVDGETQPIGKDTVVIIPANTWHEFKSRSEQPVHMINIHPAPKMITEWAGTPSN